MFRCIQKCRFSMSTAGLILLMVAQMSVLPYLFFANAHVHFVNGVVIVHWHPSSNLNSNNDNTNSASAGHSHSLEDIKLSPFSSNPYTNSSPCVQTLVLCQFCLDFSIPNQCTRSTGFENNHLSRAPPTLSRA